MNPRHTQDRLTGWYRQWKHPREFRIAPERLDAGQRERIVGHLAVLDTALADLAAAHADIATAQAAARRSAASATASKEKPEEKVDTARLAEAATGVWKAGRKLEQQDDGLGKTSRQIGRSVRTARQALQEGIELRIQDHDGDDYDPGLSLKVLSFEDDPGLTREVVLETFLPSVYFRGRLIQMGEVVVGRPPLQ
ncbi:hypothetical protein ACM01_32090 [Streptomyces viridochromogenes]|uniref:Nucleotide exchange factor GrpE n=1 Tax=Streptomyces viridochromogenes TaxID=1938 RepID=A0A0J7Z3G0_STRVR|nr:hypothetical protein [Streptomyces viridochromogenes]KMS70339.1 hypothetical protein ACM01_32090 [Streptomyces viridochromogenes]KOG17095.1 hypothetical protein ADK35_24875 [Streptomyces viridochromogenes]KOG20116.1 hypothetical protein ADK36_17535 [Streptomyces viridochromogenes]